MLDRVKYDQAIKKAKEEQIKEMTLRLSEVFDTIADLADKYNMWMHVDGASGILG